MKPKQNREAPAKSNAKGERFAAVFFTAVVVLCCAALFLVSDKGGAFLASLGFPPGERAQASLMPEETAYPPGDETLAEAEAFVQGLQNELPGLAIALAEQDARLARYTLAADGRPDAELELSLREGRVAAFLLRMEALQSPKPATAAMGPVERRLREAEEDRYIVYQVAVRDYFQALTRLADVEQTVTETEISRMCKLIFAAADKNAEETLSAGRFSFSAYTEARDGEACIVAAMVAK